VGLRDRLRRLQKVANAELVTAELRGGTTVRFSSDELPNAFLNLMNRMRAAHRGALPPPAHPFIEAVLHATEESVEGLVSNQGTWVGLILGEEPITRGEITCEQAIARRQAGVDQR
jgi:hypothetical protein